jgi:hypothetical protein
VLHRLLTRRGPELGGRGGCTSWGHLRQDKGDCSGAAPTTIVRLERLQVRVHLFVTQSCNCQSEARRVERAPDFSDSRVIWENRACRIENNMPPVTQFLRAARRRSLA